jgi:uncharacterized membrane protein YfhO
VKHPVTSSWTFTTDASTPSRLIMRVTDYPGWHASIDGRALPLSLYEGLMLEASVPAGRYVIHLWYLPKRLVIATWLALATLAALLAWAAWPLARRRSRPELVREDFGESFVPALEAAEISCRERNATVRSGA